MATSGGNFVSIAHLEIPSLIKMLMCQIIIFPAVFLYFLADLWYISLYFLADLRYIFLYFFVYLWYISLYFVYGLNNVNVTM